MEMQGMPRESDVQSVGPSNIEMKIQALACTGLQYFIMLDFNFTCIA